jgi:hypothetical protein
MAGKRRKKGKGADTWVSCPHQLNQLSKQMYTILIIKDF